MKPKPQKVTKRVRETESLTLKWGSLKEWHFVDGSPAHEAAKKYFALGSSASAIMQHDTQEQKKLILEIIDDIDCKKIYNDWDGKEMTKKAAKKYVANYGTDKE